MRRLPVLVMLKPTDHDPGRDTDASRELLDRRHRTEAAKLCRRATRYEQIPREPVSLSLPRIIWTRGRFFDPDIGLAMQQYVADLVEEGEPQMIVGFVAQAQLDQCLLWR